MKHQALFSSKDKSKKIKCHLLQILYGTLRVKSPTSKLAEFANSIEPDDPANFEWPGRVAQSVGHLTHKSVVLGLIPSLATYFRFSFCFFKKGSCQLLAKV